MPKPRWKGTSEMKEAPDSPEISKSKDGIVHTRTFNGPFSALVANSPERFQTMNGSPGILMVDTVKVTKGKGATGTMLVTLTSAPIAGPEDGSFPTTGASTVEIEWNVVQRRLETHDRYCGKSPGNHGDFLNDADLDAIEEWRNAGTRQLRSAAYANLPSDLAKEFVDKLKIGTDSYIDFNPVIRISTPSRAKPTTGKCGFRSTPPFGMGIDDYVYVKTADRVTKQGRTWMRFQEWTGAWWWDEDLYPAT